MILTIKTFTKEITVNTSHRDDTIYKPGSIIAEASVALLPLWVEISITPEGNILHRGYHWDSNRESNTYLHVIEAPDNITDAQKITVSKLFGGLKVDGLTLIPGGSLQDIVKGINLDIAETEHGRKIYLT